MNAPRTAVVVVTHGRAGADMLDAAEAFLHMSLPLTAAVGIHPDDDQTAVNAKIDQAIATLGISGREDVLFLVDLVGSTPARLCCDKCGDRGHVVTGVNMPMLLKLATADRSTPPADLGTTLVLTGTKSIHVE
ncbi:MAG TPA: hypothetical protein PKE31_03315 [Pseudomonadota bacterium]|nr:hypothetical protein [Pseudomonadota bacterium]